MAEEKPALEPAVRDLLDDLCGRAFVTVSDLLDARGVGKAVKAGYAKWGKLHRTPAVCMTHAGMTALLADAEKSKSWFDEAARWKLVAEFDPYDEAVKRGYDGPVSEARAFWMDCRRRWYAGVPEDVDELVKIDGDTVTLAADLIDYLEEPIAWLTGHTVPRRFEVRR